MSKADLRLQCGMPCSMLEASRQTRDAFRRRLFAPEPDIQPRAVICDKGYASKANRDAGLRAAKTLARKLERGDLKTGFTAHEIRRRQWSNLQTPEDVESALDWLEDSGWIRRMPPPAGRSRGGRPTVRYEVHPDLPLEAGK